MWRLAKSPGDVHSASRLAQESTAEGCTLGPAPADVSRRSWRAKERRLLLVLRVSKLCPRGRPGLHHLPDWRQGRETRHEHCRILGFDVGVDLVVAVVRENRSLFHLVVLMKILVLLFLAPLVLLLLKFHARHLTNLRNEGRDVRADEVIAFNAVLDNRRGLIEHYDLGLSPGGGNWAGAGEGARASTELFWEGLRARRTA
mmetsp:Transcript_41071/g.89744  ORF Transcript_41071/g.89744 Transcript_41071/m.89744 type:complete len:201 (-) Transcript_41071:1612-2214(-)